MGWIGSETEGTEVSNFLAIGWRILRFDVWQRNYHEEIIRNEKAYENIRRYIVENPLSWDEDEENPLKFKPIS